MAIIRDYRDLDIWKDAMDLCEWVYGLVKLFPKDEMYGLVSQMKRAAVSVPSNIAEGFVRMHGKEFRHFLTFSLSSLAELNTQSILSHRLQFIPLDRFKETCNRISLLQLKIEKFRRGIKK